MLLIIMDGKNIVNVVYVNDGTQGKEHLNSEAHEICVDQQMW